jgi:hypothetical protein
MMRRRLFLNIGKAELTNSFVSAQTPQPDAEPTVAMWSFRPFLTDGDQRTDRWLQRVDAS